MTTLASLVADVYSLTNRPDLVGETQLAIRAATLKAHGSDFYYKDLFETGIQFDFSLNQQTLAYKDLIPRWRSLSYLRRYEYTAGSGELLGCAGKFLTVITPESVLDSYSINRENVCYVAGLVLHIRALTASQYYLLGCYVYPDVTINGYSSWIADESPFAIVYEAAATIFKAIGFDEQAAFYRGLVADEYALLKITNIQAKGE